MKFLKFIIFTIAFSQFNPAHCGGSGGNDEIGGSSSTTPPAKFTLYDKDTPFGPLTREDGAQALSAINAGLKPLVDPGYRERLTDAHGGTPQSLMEYLTEPSKDDPLEWVAGKANNGMFKLRALLKQLLEKTGVLEKEVAELKEDIQRLREENSRLGGENARLTQQIEVGSSRPSPELRASPLGGFPVQYQAAGEDEDFDRWFQGTLGADPELGERTPLHNNISLTPPRHWYDYLQPWKWFW